MELQQKYQDLQAVLNALDRVVVAYSGGVDSTFLLKAAVDTLGAGQVLACIGVSPSLARHQYDQAMDHARLIGATLKEIPVDELSDADYAANRADRCYHCKSHLYSVLKEVGTQAGLGTVVCGSNFDDREDYRPGNRAAVKLHIRSPLMEARLTKADIRALSRDLGLPTAEIPASPCLASRLAYGLEITSERLAQVEKAEDIVRSLGLQEFRVRHHDTLARIEVPPADMAQVLENRRHLVEAIKALGFTFVSLDLQGFRSGSLNEMLGEHQQRRFD